MCQRRREADERVLLVRGGGFTLHNTLFLLYGNALSQIPRFIYV